MTGALRLLSTSAVTHFYAPRFLQRIPTASAGSASSSSMVGLASLTTVSLRCVSRRSAAAAAATAAVAAPKKTRGRKRKSTPISTSDSAASTRPSSQAASTSPPLPTAPADIAEQTAAAAVTAQRCVAEKQLEENDVRMAIRTLMTSHLCHRSFDRKQQHVQLEKERAEHFRRHEARERRLFAKDANSLRLLGEDGRSLGDGIVPFVPVSDVNPYKEAVVVPLGPRAALGGEAVWRTLNPVGLAASQAAAAAAAAAAVGGENDVDTDALSEEDYAAFLASPAAASAAAGRSLTPAAAAAADTDADALLTGADDWRSATLATLCAPNLSIYDTDRDFRVSSAEVVQQSKRSQGVTQPSLAPVATSLAAGGVGAEGGEELSSDVPAAVAAQLKRRFAEEEEDDVDFAVSLYTAGGDDDTDEGPLQL